MINMTCLSALHMFQSSVLAFLLHLLPMSASSRIFPQVPQVCSTHRYNTDCPLQRCSTTTNVYGHSGTNAIMAGSARNIWSVRESARESARMELWDWECNGECVRQREWEWEGVSERFDSIIVDGKPWNISSVTISLFYSIITLSL